MASTEVFIPKNLASSLILAGMIVLDPNEASIRPSS